MRRRSPVSLIRGFILSPRRDAGIGAKQYHRYQCWELYQEQIPD